MCCCTRRVVVGGSGGKVHPRGVNVLPYKACCCRVVGGKGIDIMISHRQRKFLSFLILLVSCSRSYVLSIIKQVRHVCCCLLIFIVVMSYIVYIASYFSLAILNISIDQQAF